MTTEGSESRIRKIEALLRKAERAGTPEEADAFFAGAQALMTKWAIDEAMLSTEGRSNDEIVSEHFGIKRSGYFKSMVRLMLSVTEANDCKMLVYSPSAFGTYAGVDIIGYRSDVEKCKMLYTSLLIQATKERGSGCPDHVKNAGGTAIARWRISFSYAYARRIGERLREQRDLTRSEATEEYGGSLLPALIDRSEAVERFYDDLPKGKPRMRTITLDRAGADAGERAANRADLGNTRVSASARGELR